MAQTRKGTKVTEILSTLDDDEINNLVSTVTQGLLKNKINNREEAVKAIINYSPSTISILRRKIITREVLLSYLHDKSIPVVLPITKPELIDKILSIWGEHKGDSLSRSSSSGSLDETINFSAREDENQLEKSENSVTVVKDNVWLLAQQFSGWFFEMLNKSTLGAEHLYQDAVLNLKICSNTDTTSEEIKNNPQEIINKLLATKIQHELFFNPNLSPEGTKGQMDPHGLVMIMSCGTLHTKDICVGVFEQLFAIARDPFSENNWKIKKLELCLKSSNSVPKISEKGEESLGVVQLIG